MAISRALSLALTLALSLTLAPALAQTGAFAPMPGVHAVTVGNATIGHWVGTAGAVDENVTHNETASIWFALAAPSNGSRMVVHLNVTPSSATLAIPNGTVTLDTDPAGRSIQEVAFESMVPADAGVVNMTYTFAGDVYEETNGTLALVGPVSGEGAFTYDVGAYAPAPIAPGFPRGWLVGGAALLVLGVVVGAVTARQRAIRRRMNEGPRRSQVMRERELEQKMQRAKAPGEVREIQQEIRQAEQVREKRRELQILEAKRADALKTIDLLRKRHESGGLTKLQFDNMVAKKQADLARIEAEIAEMERQDAGAAA